MLGNTCVLETKRPVLPGYQCVYARAWLYEESDMNK